MSLPLYDAVKSVSLPRVKSSLRKSTPNEISNALVLAAGGPSNEIFDLLLAHPHSEFATSGALRVAAGCGYLHGLGRLLPRVPDCRGYVVSGALSEALTKRQDDVALCILAHVPAGFDAGTDDLELAVTNCGPEVVRALLPFSGPLGRASGLFAAATARPELIGELVPYVKDVAGVIERLLVSRHWRADSAPPAAQLAAADRLLSCVPRATALKFIKRQPALGALPCATALVQQAALEKVIGPGKERHAPRM